MKKIAIGLLIISLAACGSAPKPPQATGEWVPVNHTQSK